MASVTFPTTQRPFDLLFTPIGVIGSALVNAGFGALAARIETRLRITSISGAIFGATWMVGNAVVRHFANREGCEPTLRTAIKIVGFFSSIYLGALVSTALGHPLSFCSALGLHFATIGIVVGGVVVASAVVFSVAVIAKAIKDRTNVITAAQNIVQEADLQNFDFLRQLNLFSLQG
jgi:hypothetical protein